MGSGARVREIGKLFARLGVTAFGGPAAHVSLMEDECVGRGWVTREVFADLWSAANVLPGPSSTELAMLLGLRRGGWWGLVVAGVSFILPTTAIVWTLAWWYVRSGSMPAVAALLTGMQPVVLAVILQAVWRLGRSVIRSGAAAILVAASMLALALGAHELAVLLGAAIVSVIWHLTMMSGRTGGGPDAGGTFATMSRARNVLSGATVAASSMTAAAASTVSSLSVFTTFLKLGCVVFGSGYVLLGFLRADLVQRHAWITERQLLDAIAIGQVTPGPVFSTATFIGFLVDGHAGAASATVGMFLPAFVFAASSGFVVHRIRASPVASAALDGVNAASLALMAMVVVSMARIVVPSIVGAGLTLVALVLLLTGRVGAGWLMAGGAAIAIVRLWV